MPHLAFLVNLKPRAYQMVCFKNHINPSFGSQDYTSRKNLDHHCRKQFIGVNFCLNHFLTKFHSSIHPYTTLKQTSQIQHKIRTRRKLVAEPVSKPYKTKHCLTHIPHPHSFMQHKAISIIGMYQQINAPFCPSPQPTWISASSFCASSSTSSYASSSTEKEKTTTKQLASSQFRHQQQHKHLPKQIPGIPQRSQPQKRYRCLNRHQVLKESMDLKSNKPNYSKQRH